jgi:hypothetical protein
VQRLQTVPLHGGRRSIEALFDAMKGDRTGEVLVNVINAHASSPALTRAAYSVENYQRLVALKDKYDPSNVFRVNHNIPPSGT